MSGVKVFAVYGDPNTPMEVGCAVRKKSGGEVCKVGEIAVNDKGETVVLCISFKNELRRELVAINDLEKCRSPYAMDIPTSGYGFQKR